MAWAVDGFVQLLTGVSLLGDPLVELGEEGAIVTGSLQLGYGATLAILSPFFLEALGVPVVWALVFFASCLRSNRNEWASVVCRISSDWSCGMACWRCEQGSRSKAASHWLCYFGDYWTAAWRLSLGRYGAGEHACRGASTVSVIPLSVPIMGAVLAGIKDHWLTGVGMRGFGTYALATDAAPSRALLRRGTHT